MRAPRLILAISAAVLLGGCVAELAAPELLGEALLEAGAEEALAVGAMAEEVVGFEIAATDEAALLRSGALRVQPRVLQAALTRLAAETDGAALLRVDALGKVWRPGASSFMGTIEADGAIVVDQGGRRLLVGWLRPDGIWDVAVSGAPARVIGDVEGFAPGNGVRLASDPWGATTVDILRPDVSVRVIGYADGWFKIQLISGRSGWVWGPSLALTVMMAPAATHQRDSDCMQLTTGQVLRDPVRIGGVVSAKGNGGQRLLVDPALVAPTCQQCAWETQESFSLVHLENGQTIYASSVAKDGDLRVIRAFGGQEVLAERGAVASVVVHNIPHTAARRESWRERSAESSGDRPHGDAS
jgi:hypothetical protein